MYRAVGGDHAMGQTTIAVGKQQHNENSPFLFVIIIGGRHASTDLESIAQSWGKRVDVGVLYTNTPAALANGTQILQATGHPWSIRPTALTAPTTSRKYWTEMLSIMHEQLEKQPNIQWIARSDSGAPGFMCVTRYNCEVD